MKKMKEKKDNNLLKVTLPDGTVHYFTSSNRCALWLNVKPSVVEYNMRYNNGNIKSIGTKLELVDGSHVEYKDIN